MIEERNKDDIAKIAELTTNINNTAKIDNILEEMDETPMLPQALTMGKPGTDLQIFQIENKSPAITMSVIAIFLIAVASAILCITKRGNKREFTRGNEI